jgi:hypothetical protein
MCSVEVTNKVMLIASKPAGLSATPLNLPQSSSSSCSFEAQMMMTMVVVETWNLFLFSRLLSGLLEKRFILPRGFNNQEEKERGQTSLDSTFLQPDELLLQGTLLKNSTSGWCLLLLLRLVQGVLVLLLLLGVLLLSLHIHHFPVIM